MKPLEGEGNEASGGEAKNGVGAVGDTGSLGGRGRWAASGGGRGGGSASASASTRASAGASRSGGRQGHTLKVEPMLEGYHGAYVGYVQQQRTGPGKLQEQPRDRQRSCKPFECKRWYW